MKDLPHFNPEEHNVVMEFSMAPTILELTHICTREEEPKHSQQITCTLVGGDQVMLYVEPQEMGCLPDDEMSPSDSASDAPGMARYVLIKVAKQAGGEPKFWLVVCSKSRTGWLVFYGDYPDEDVGDFMFIHTQMSRVAVAPI